MKKIFIIFALVFVTAFASATNAFYLADENESWGECYITEENQAEWDEDTARLEAIMEYPELADIFALMDSYLLEADYEEE